MNVIKLLTFFVRVIILHSAILINEVEQREPYICNIITDRYSEEKTNFMLQHFDVREKTFYALTIVTKVR